MSARDELLRVIYENGPRLLQGGNPTWDAAADMGLQRAPYEQADAVLSEWLPTLADDVALVGGIEDRIPASLLAAMTPLRLKQIIRALAAALTPPP